MSETDKSCRTCFYYINSTSTSGKCKKYQEVIYVPNSYYCLDYKSAVNTTDLGLDVLRENLNFSGCAADECESEIKFDDQIDAVRYALNEQYGNGYSNKDDLDIFLEKARKPKAEKKKRYDLSGIYIQQADFTHRPAPRHYPVEPKFHSEPENYLAEMTLKIGGPAKSVSDLRRYLETLLSSEREVDLLSAYEDLGSPEYIRNILQGLQKSLNEYQDLGTFKEVSEKLKDYERQNNSLIEQILNFQLK